MSRTYQATADEFASFVNLDDAVKQLFPLLSERLKSHDEDREWMKKEWGSLRKAWYKSNPDAAKPPNKESASITKPMCQRFKISMPTAAGLQTARQVVQAWSDREIEAAVARRAQVQAQHDATLHEIEQRLQLLRLGQPAADDADDSDE